MRVPVIQIPMDDPLNIETEKSVGPLESFLINLYEGFRMMLETAIIR
jgi:hypothetical protein